MMNRRGFASGSQKALVKRKGKKGQQGLRLSLLLRQGHICMLILAKKPVIAYEQ